MFLIIGVIFIVYFALRQLPGEKSLALKRLSGLLVGVAAILAILFPNILSKVATFVGIGRGTDLLLYLFIIFMMLFTVAVIRAKARTDARVTELARAVALLEAEKSEE